MKLFLRRSMTNVLRLLPRVVLICVTLSVTAFAQDRCGSVLIKAEDPSTIDWVHLQREILAGKIDALVKSHGSEFFEKNWSRFSGVTKSYLYTEFILPKFTNTLKYRNGILDRPFVADYNEMPSTWTNDVSQVTPSQFDQAGEIFSDQLNTFIWRGSANQKTFPEVIYPDIGEDRGMLLVGQELRGVVVEQNINELLETLYREFAKQGPERQILVPTVRKQDEMDQERTTHFIVRANKAVHLAETAPLEMGHLQVMLSNNEHEPLHFEDQWGKTERKPGEIVGEVGRYIFAYSPTRLEGADKLLLRLKLWQKLLSWSNHDVKIDRLFFQVNGRVRDILMGYGLPLDKAVVKKVQANYDGETVEEYIFELDRNILLLSEKRIQARILEMEIEQLMSAAEMKAENAGVGVSSLRLGFRKNQIWSLIQMGLIRLAGDSNVNLTAGVLPQKHDYLFSSTFGASPLSNRFPQFELSLEQLRSLKSFTLVFSEKDALQIINLLKKVSQAN